MSRILLLVMVLTILAGTTYMVEPAYSQEIGLATFQESAQIIVDMNISNKSTASIVLQSTSTHEIRIPAELEQKIRQDKMVQAVVFTNQDQCVLGVREAESCIMINIKRNPDDQGIIAIQESSRRIADQYIDEINQALKVDAQFHSVFIHTDDESNRALETSGIISGRGTISAVYTMPMEDTDSMYQKITALLIPREIRDGGGFYDVARWLASSSSDDAKVTFSLIPSDAGSLLQIKLSVSSPTPMSANIMQIKPLEFLKVDRIDRSEYFVDGFYPLNSIIQIVILLPTSDFSVTNTAGNTLPTQSVNGEKIPIDVSMNGWIFDPDQGRAIQGKYIFGKQATVTDGDLTFTLVSAESPPGTGINNNSTTPTPPTGGTDVVDNSQSFIVLGIITVAAVAAAAFYLKGYRTKK